MSSLKKIIGNSQDFKLSTLSTDALNFFDLLTLIVDIKYRDRYGHSLDFDEDESYRRDMLNNLPEQIPPVDYDLEGVVRREISDGTQ